MGDQRYYAPFGAPPFETARHEPQLSAQSYAHAQQVYAQPYPGQPYPHAPQDWAPPPHAPYGHPPHAAPRQASRKPQTGAVMHGLGAVLSLALIVGAGGWMWQLMKRDVTGVPVVRALEGPLRVAPEDPGGRQAAHQGLAVNELAAARESLPAETIMLAPPPVGLAAEDMSPQQRPAAPDALPVSAPAPMQPVAVALQQEITAPSESAPLGFSSPTRRAVEASPRPVARDPSRIDQSRVAALSAPSVTSNDFSDDLAASVAQSVATGLTAVRALDVDPATIGPGTRLVQLGAYDDRASAEAAWSQLARRFSPLLDERGRVIEAAHSGGSVFYRLRAHGFTDERDARRFCAALVDQQIDCIPVLIR